MHTSERPQLTKEAIVSTAISMADTLGIDKLSMRNLGAELGVEAMSLYYYVPNKAQLLLEMTNRIISNMHDAQHDQPWRSELHKPMRSAFDQLDAHPWAVGQLMRLDAGYPPAFIGWMPGLVACATAASRWSSPTTRSRR